MAQWQRQSARPGGRAGVPGRPERSELAEPRRILRVAGADHGDWAEWRKDDWAVRLGPPDVLVCGHKERRSLRLQHRDESRAGAAAGRISHAIHSQRTRVAD